MRPLVAGMLLMPMACTAIPSDGEPGNEAPREVGVSGYRCRAEALADLVGRAATQELGAEALRRSGSRALRWIRPGDIVSMDYRQDRLNIHLDGRNRVESFACG